MNTDGDSAENINELRAKELLNLVKVIRQILLDYERSGIHVYVPYVLETIDSVVKPDPLE